MDVNGGEARIPQPGCLILVCGLPGSGKTTAALTLANDRRGVRLNPDEWMTVLGIDRENENARERVEALQWRLAQDLLRGGAVVIVEWGTWTKAERGILRDNARELDARVELRLLEVPMDELWRRIQVRGLEDPPVQRSDLEQWARTFEPPDELELALFDVSHG
jgi:predicted kinase